jgi:hypothetical protein
MSVHLIVVTVAWAATAIVGILILGLLFYSPFFARLANTFSTPYLIFLCVLGFATTVVAFAVIYQDLDFNDPASFVCDGSCDFQGRGVDGLYLSAVTITTTGFGDIHPHTRLAKTYVVIEVMFGYLYALFFFSTIAGRAFRSNVGRQVSTSEIPPRGPPA